MAGDWGVLTNRREILDRGKQISKEFGYRFQSWDQLETFMEEKTFPSVILAVFDGPQGGMSPSELAQTVRFSATEPYLICGGSPMVIKDQAEFAKKSGAQLVLADDEILKNGKLEFVLNHSLRTPYVPVKTADLNDHTALPFDLYHLMPQRMKFLKIAETGDLLPQAKLQKLGSVGELYVHRNQSEALSLFLKSSPDQSAEALQRRARSCFQSLNEKFFDLICRITDQSDAGSFTLGQKLIAEIKARCRELYQALSKANVIWDTIDNASIGDTGLIERAPAIATYCGYGAHRAAMSSPDELMMLALLAEIGSIFLPHEVLHKVRAGEPLVGAELTAFQSYPERSVQVVLERKLPLSEKVRHILIATYEGYDGKGFPKALLGTKVPLEAQVIRLCRALDQRTVVKVGKTRISLPDAWAELMKDSEFSAAFSPEVLELGKKLVN